MILCLVPGKKRIQPSLVVAWLDGIICLRFYVKYIGRLIIYDFFLHLVITIKRRFSRNVA